MASKFRIPAIIMPITISIGTQPSIWVVFSFVPKDSGILEISADNSLHISKSLIPKLFVLRALIRFLHFKV